MRRTSGTITFLCAPKYASKWPSSQATAALLTRDLSQIAGEPGAGRALLYVRNVDDAMAKVLELFAPPGSTPASGRHSLATIDRTAEIHPSASVGPGCVIAARARIRAHTNLVAQVYVVQWTLRSANTARWHPGVRVLDRCIVGNRCILHPGVCIGADGFGYRATNRGRPRSHTSGTWSLRVTLKIGAILCGSCQILIHHDRARHQDR